MVRQYQRIKAEHPDEILLYRVGDFYETFGEDAKEASAILGIALTKKHIGNGRTMPLAGVPYHALDTYLGKLVRAGRRVAICEQIEDPKDAEGPIVKREVVRVVTPGTLIEENLLEDKQHNYLACAVLSGGRWALARCDLSTGELAATQFAGGGEPRDALVDELARIRPAELLVRESELEELGAALKADFGAMTLTRIDDGLVSENSARASLVEQLGVHDLKGYGAEEAPAAVCAAGGLIGYLRETQRRMLGHIHHLELYCTSDFLMLDATTQRSLELLRNLIDGGKSATLLSVLDHTSTPMGGRLLRRWIVQPLQDLEAIRARQSAIGGLIDNPAYADQIATGLRGVRDLERILSRVHCRSSNARDLFALAKSLREVPSIKSAAQRLGAGAFVRLADEIETLGSLAESLESALHPEPPVGIRDGGMIRDGFDEELDRLREISRGGKSWIGAMRQAEVERTGIGSLKIGYNRVFGYYIEISKANADKVPEEYERRQTLINSERYITPELKSKEAEILGAEDRICDLEGRLFEMLRVDVETYTARIQTLAANLAECDTLGSLARAALEYGFVRPEVDGSDLLEIEGGRHPVIEAELATRPFIPNDTLLDSREQQIWLITGPNMAGKSTYIRQVALIALMAHMGSYVPARRARVGLIDRIFTRVGATDYLTRGQSTFLVEMSETASILNNATARSLIILDEIGRGTSTYDGLSIAWAVIEYLHEQKGKRAKTLFATHYHELTDLADRLPRLRNYNVLVKEQGETITFLYKIVEGGSDHSYGIHAARLAGIPKKVVDRAREILFELECSAPVGEEANISEIPSHNAPNLETGSGGADQLDFFGAHDPIVDELKKIDIDGLTPIQAIRLLDDFVKAARER